MIDRVHTVYARREEGGPSIVLSGTPREGETAESKRTNTSNRIRETGYRKMSKRIVMVTMVLTGLPRLSQLKIKIIPTSANGAPVITIEDILQSSCSVCDGKVNDWIPSNTTATRINPEAEESSAESSSLPTTKNVSSLSSPPISSKNGSDSSIHTKHSSTPIHATLQSPRNHPRECAQQSCSCQASILHSSAGCLPTEFFSELASPAPSRVLLLCTTMWHCTSKGLSHQSA